MNLQEMFDMVAAHLLTQKAKAENDAGECMYRGENGLKCAVGVLIPDEVYTPSMELRGIRYLLGAGDSEYESKELKDAKRFLRGLIDTHDKEMLARDLQTVHDDHGVLTWHLSLRKIADNFGLSTAVVDRLTGVAL